MGFYFVYIFHITYIKKMYTETERERDSPFWVDVEPPPSNAQICLNTPTAPSKPSQGRPYLFHRHSSPGVFSESHKKKNMEKKSGKTMGKKKFVHFLILMEKGSSSHLRQTDNCCIQIKMSEWTKKNCTT